MFIPDSNNRQPLDRQSRRSIRRQAQRGVALLVTLIILVVVTILGVSALRAGFLHVAIATNSQVETLLFQAADTGTQTLETLVNADKVAAMQADGLVGMVTAGTEKVACLTSASGFVKYSASSSAPCTITGSTPQYMSGRKLVAVQTALVSPASPSSQTGDQKVAPDGSDVDATQGAGNTKFVAISTAVMPNFGSGTTSSVQACLNKPSYSDDATVDTVSKCLTTLGAAYSSTTQEYYWGLSGKATVQ